MRSFANGSWASLPRTRCAASSSSVSGSRRDEPPLAITLLDPAALSFPGAPPRKHRSMTRYSKMLAALLLAAALPAPALTQQAQPQLPPDLTTQPTLYVVPYAHLDTQWRWDYATTIGQYLPSTLRDNFALFEKYPHYVFNFSGANRYRMIKEYYPADYAKVKKYVAAGRWFPSGSSMEENDVNSPSAESIIRQVLYGKLFFRREFGKTSAEYMLPDCFGFPASLPSILVHA